MMIEKYSSNKKLITIITLLLLSYCLFAQDEKDVTEVLVLGTPHLSQIEDFDPKMMKEVLYRLDKFDFDVIGIENMPGELLYDIKNRENPIYSGILDGFAGERIFLAELLQAELNKSYVEAKKDLNELIESDNFNSEDSVLLIKHFIATTDLLSAALYYEKVRYSQDLIWEDTIKSSLNKILNSSNELNVIGIELAKIEELKKLNYIDNLQDEPILLKNYPSFIKEFQANKKKIDSLINQSHLIKIQTVIKESVAAGNMLGLYSFLNSDSYQEVDFENQWKLWFKTNFESNGDLARYYLWEMRNLQIAANVTKLAALNPGKRILIVIGSAHKLFLERHLHSITNVKLLNWELK